MPYTLHYPNKDGQPHESHIDTRINMLAVLAPGDHIEGSEFGGKHGEVATEYGLLVLSGYQPDVDIIFQKIEVKG